jgi:hypothetical protein
VSRRLSAAKFYMWVARFPDGKQFSAGSADEAKAYAAGYMANFKP